MNSPTPWRWIPSLYLAEGWPYAAVMTLSVVMYKNLGVPNTEIALYTSWLYLPWVIKPLWSPLVDLIGTPRRWVLVTQALLGMGLALVAFTLPGPLMLQSSLAVLWLVAFASATHDIAADGFYLQALDPRQQAAFVGVRSTFYRLAMVSTQGGLVVLAGWLQQRHGSVVTAWGLVFGGLGGAMLVLAGLHTWALPRPAPAPRDGLSAGLCAFLRVFAAYFRRPGLARVLGFLLLYRFAEAQLLKMVLPFLLDAPSAGGLGLSNQAVGVAYGTVGVLALTLGGLLGGWLISRHGLARCLWPMVLSLNAPNVVYVLLALWPPQADVLGVVSVAVALEQFGYGLGFAAYMVYLLRLAQGPHPVAHFAIGTGLMALGMMLPGMAAGWLQQQLGYLGFFIWVCVATVPCFVATALVRIDPAEGR